MSGLARGGSPESLVQRYFDGELGAEGAAGLREWLEASDSNLQAFAEQLEIHAALRDDFAGAAALSVSGFSPRRSPLRSLMRLAAALLLIASGLALWLMNRRGEQPGIPLGRALTAGLTMERNGTARALPIGAEVRSSETITAAQSGLLQLAEGSTVKLDRGARLALARPGAGERVRLGLDAGRIFLRVSREPGVFVIAGSAEVRVVGTVFGVEESGGRTAVNVLDGCVALTAAESTLELVRGQSGSAAGGIAPELTGADVDEALRWARDWTRFDDRPLGEVIEWLEANSSYRFQVGDPRRVQQRVTVTVDDEPPREVIEALMLSCGLDYRFDGNNVSVK